MALVLEILLGVAILASFFVAYMSARVWPVYQVVLVVFLFLSLVGFFYLAARTLATHQAWQTAYNKLQADLANVQKQTSELVDGGPTDENGQPNPKGIKQLQQDLQKLTIERGGVLFDVAVEGVSNDVLQLALPSADHGLVPNVVLFVFDQTPRAEGGRYAGEFKVVAVGDDATKVQITPNLPLSKAQAERLKAVKGPLAMYAAMPVDDPAEFAALDEATRGGLLPPGSVKEFAEATRKLRDYEQSFHESFVQQSLLADAISKLTNNIERMTAATQEAEKEAAYREGEKVKLAADLSKFEFEREAILKYRNSLEKLYQQVRDSLKATYLQNRQMAGDLTVRQLDAAAQIDARSSAAASVGTGGAGQP